MLIFLLLFSLANAALSQGDRGTFASPKTGVKWRYWIEDASADPEVLRYDVAEMARVGSSGFELLSYQSYGGVENNTGLVLIDPTDVAFGSDRFLDLTVTMIEAAKENNLTIDFTLGPSQGSGVPIRDVDQEGMLGELVFGSHFLQPGESFNGALPSPFIRPFVNFDGVIRSANTTNNTLLAVVGAKLADDANTTASIVNLDFDSVVDLTQQVQTDSNISRVSWEPSLDGASVLLAFYSRRNGFPTAVGGFDGIQDDKPGSWGAYVVDHFSAKGVEIASKFIEENVLSRSKIRELLTQPGVGKYMWEDSMEFEAQVWWTESLPRRFIDRHGYSINKALPILHNLSPGRGGKLNQTFGYSQASGNTSIAFLGDYQDTLTSLYLDYITAWNEWSKSIGLEYSNQPAYGNGWFMDVSAAAAIPSTPEIESLGVAPIDEVHQLSGGVHLGNHTIFSSELGARFNFSGSLSITQLLSDVKSQFAGGVNMALLHGYPYSGSYPNTTWPGITTFAYNYAEMHGPRNPAWAWDHYKEYLDFVARNQYILQSGIAKVDVAIHRKDYGLAKTEPFHNVDTTLIGAGYSYEYVSPENFKLPGVTVTNGRLAAGGPAYKAFLVNRNWNITIEAVQSLIEFADNGLPIVISGGVPIIVPNYDPDGTQSERVRKLLAHLVEQPTVKVVNDEFGVPDALATLGVTPSARANPPAASLSTVRRDEGSETAHFYLYNKGPDPINFTLILSPGFTGTPYALDAWTGQVKPVFIWSNTPDGGIEIPSVSLAINETALFTVTSDSEFEGISSLSVHIVDAGPDVTAAASESGAVELRSMVEGAKEITLPNGQKQTVNFSLKDEETRELTGWQLNITIWEPPKDLSEVKSVLVPQLPMNLTQGLVPWDKIEGYENASGVGTYVTTFEWSHGEDSEVGVQLDFGAVVHTLKAWLNGAQIPTADPTKPVVDVSPLVKEGRNALRVDVASTLVNTLNAVPEVVSLGQVRIKTMNPLPGNQHYGLIVPVHLVPYARVKIQLI
uniref:Secreted protein n=1 Tax=Moniliophthora roreri TaxID=221103 RepID=A0A0W0F3T5_MONRR